MSVPQNKVYLSRRNLLTLLSKLDRKAKGETTFCEVWKLDDQHPTMSSTPTRIIAVENEDYYIDREPGDVVVADRERIK